MEILENFGVQPILLAAQIVNFLVLLFILKKILYKPILQMLKHRKEKIAESLKQSEEIEQRLKVLSDEEEKAILKAIAEGEKIIKQSQDAGLQIIEESRLKAEKLAETIVDEARSQLRVEKDLLQKEMRAHLSEIVTISLEKVTGKIIDKKDQKLIIERSIKGM